MDSRWQRKKLVVLWLAIFFSPVGANCNGNHYSGETYSSLVALGLGDALATLGYDQVTWDSKSDVPTNDKSWLELSDDERTAAKAFCYDRLSWEGCTAQDNRICTETDQYDEFDWGDLPKEVQKHYKVLGWTENLWDNGGSALTDSLSWEELSQKQKEAAISLCLDQNSWNECDLTVLLSPTFQPSMAPATPPPTRQPTPPTFSPVTPIPTRSPTDYPTLKPTLKVILADPSMAPALSPPTMAPTLQKSNPGGGKVAETSNPTVSPVMPTSAPNSSAPTKQQTSTPTSKQTKQPTMQPTMQSTKQPMSQPTNQPTNRPTKQPASKSPHSPVPDMPTTSSPTTFPSTPSSIVDPLPTELLNDDCKENHFWETMVSREKYFWDFMAIIGLKDSLVTLGYNQTSWDNKTDVATSDKPWNELTDDERLAAEKLCYDELSWDGCTTGDERICTETGQYENVDWGDIPPTAQGYYQTLGWSQTMWDGGGSAASDSKTWSELTPAEQDAARMLCFDQNTWNSCDTSRYESPTTDAPMVPSVTYIPTATPTTAEPTLFNCNGDNFEDEKWNELVALGLKDSLTALGYDQTSWTNKNDVATSDKKWQDLTDNEKAAATAFCFDQLSWDGCTGQDNRICTETGQYDQSDWGQIPETAREHYEVLGWSQGMWDGGGVPVTDSKSWEELSVSEKEAAQFLCYDQDTWNGCNGDRASSGSIHSPDFVLLFVSMATATMWGTGMI